ncbi:MAG: hypothetical protein HY329_03900 [Chloroflexi bacterium]|nr:hypothetical protein [Chloroflexota bacterium]
MADELTLIMELLTLMTLTGIVLVSRLALRLAPEPATIPVGHARSTAEAQSLALDSEARRIAPAFSRRSSYHRPKDGRSSYQFRWTVAGMSPCS